MARHEECLSGWISFHLGHGLVKLWLLRPLYVLGDFHFFQNQHVSVTAL